MKRGFLTSLILLAAMVPLCAQPEDVRRASLRGGGGGGGKCTIEVDVDDVAEVAITGDVGRLKTLGGGRALWRRFECTGPLPMRPDEFRFSGVDGRGRQTLIRDPRDSRGTAVIRIEDPKGGREGYTFDIEWRGAGGFGGGPIAPPPGPRFDRGQAIQFCQDAVMAKADREYGYRDIDVRNARFDDGRGREWITGTFEGRRGPGREFFQFSCSIDLDSGRIRTVDIVRQGGGGPGMGRGAEVIRACQDAVADKIGRDGFRDPDFRSADFDRRRDGYIVGSLVARDRYGNSNFDFSCSVDRGRIGSVDVVRR